jgi:predicted nucleic acid-binding protein
MYVLDTNVLSELRKATKGTANPDVVAWATAVPATSLFISAITIMELELGVLLKEKQDPAQGAVFRAWLDTQVGPAFTEHILPVDDQVAVEMCSLARSQPEARSR